MNDPYSQIYPLYDDLMSFINYRSWLKYVEKLLFRDRIRSKDIFDLACGTGECMKIWLELGYKVRGLDRSPGMLEMARKKIGDHGELIQADMRDFTLTSRAPIIACLYDSLNYLLVEDELVSCFRSVYNALTDGGVFIFDMNTIFCLKSQWDNQTIVRENGHIYSIWKNTWDEIKSVSTLHVTLFVRANGTYSKSEEVHQERGYPVEVIKGLLEQTGFVGIDVFQHMTFLPVMETTSRIMVKARRP